MSHCRLMLLMLGRSGLSFPYPVRGDHSRRWCGMPYLLMSEASRSRVAVPSGRGRPRGVSMIVASTIVFCLTSMPLRSMCGTTASKAAAP